jgi:hypothetical protein
MAEFRFLKNQNRNRVSGETCIATPSTLAKGVALLTRKKKKPPFYAASARKPMKQRETRPRKSLENLEKFAFPSRKFGISN